MNGDTIVIGWLIAVIIFVVIEVSTLGLATVWFAFGSVVALLAALLHFPFAIQLALFLLISLSLLAFTRPILKDYLKVGITKTNLDIIVDSIGIVTKDIEPFKVGQVKVNGQIWTGISEDNQFIGVGTEIKIIRIEGVKLIVKRKKEE